MTTFIISATVILTLASVAASIWSLINTRNIYFKEYKDRKRND
ncbi:hypothetical protein [Francisella orientalis]|uniref:Uncharacterized protein n=1 Tax=Francisella orientalis TaxID=299583 RepID=A0ABM6MCR0_9GAMM|nr:hypothetical protein [Francisella orientalis]AHB99104.1 hypothetical protein M973_03065 [Francisella orientalis LADL 07-285A]ASU11162.1 hypothetical protein FNO01_0509a [Francisella orientalis]ASV63827.1 hypothetical protein FNO12_0509a [Francisella orientalis FNO12]ASV63844.1 hypothetical protein FNO24_0509a [Francisella orientalis FNO24]ASV63859.1 hypothetical protein FNO190_0509a [Francisella orientalis]